VGRYVYLVSFDFESTRLFREAEEIEEVDDGNMLQRVVKVQDILLSIGVTGVQNRLRDAERP
jgi:hypothetical protein